MGHKSLPTGIGQAREESERSPAVQVDRSCQLSAANSAAKCQHKEEAEVWGPFKTIPSHGFCLTMVWKVTGDRCEPEKFLPGAFPVCESPSPRIPVKIFQFLTLFEKIK